MEISPKFFIESSLKCLMDTKISLKHDSIKRFKEGAMQNVQSVRFLLIQLSSKRENVKRFEIKPSH